MRTLLLWLFGAMFFGPALALLLWIGTVTLTDAWHNSPIGTVACCIMTIGLAGLMALGRIRPH